MARLTHLQRLEAESIQILREAVSECENPVMLYSVGKDSSVMLHLAMKAFYPSKPPFPLLHVDTTWKFQEMYRFRDQLVETSASSCSFIRTLRPSSEGSTRSTTAPPSTPTSGRPRGSSRRWTSTASIWPSAALGVTRRSPGRRSGSSPSAPSSTAGIRSLSARSCGSSTTRGSPTGRERAGLPAVELDRARRVAVHPPGGDPDRAAVLRGAPAGGRARRHA